MTYAVSVLVVVPEGIEFDELTINSAARILAKREYPTETIGKVLHVEQIEERRFEVDLEVEAPA